MKFARCNHPPRPSALTLVTYPTASRAFECAPQPSRGPSKAPGSGRIRTCRVRRRGSGHRRTDAGIARAAGVPNACRLLHITRGLASKVYGAKADVLNSATTGGAPPNLGAACEVSQGIGARHFIGGINAEPCAASQYSALVAAYRSPGLKATPLRLLGNGALFVHDAHPTDDAIVFKRGRYSVLLTSIEAGGVAANHYPTEKMYLTIAHAVFAHLR